MFKGIGNLQALRLYKNQLVEINMYMFKETPNLTSLSIDGNSITTIEAGSFTTKMKYLYLHDNNLTTLSSEIFDLNGGHPVYLDISLSGNPLFCDGRLCWVKRGAQDRWLWFAGSGDTYKPQCANFPSTTWDNVDLNCPWMFGSPAKKCRTILFPFWKELEFVKLVKYKSDSEHDFTLP